MKLQDQVCTLEQAKRLKELGVSQHSEFYFRSKNVWHFSEVTDWPNQEQLSDLIESGAEAGIIFSAYTVAELGEMLPDYLTVDSYRMHPRFYKQEQNNSPALWTATYGNSEDKDVPDFYFNNEAHCRAALLIWLIESNLTTIEQINK